ncbi:MAG: hypothetical protein ACHQNA_03535 [Acidimicrobiales bacterium]
MARAIPSGATLGATTVSAVSTSFPLSGDEHEAQTAYTVAGRSEVQTDRLIHLYRGRYYAVIVVTSCTCAPFPDQQLTPALVQTVAGRMSALPAS